VRQIGEWSDATSKSWQTLLAKRLRALPFSPGQIIEHAITFDQRNARPRQFRADFFALLLSRACRCALVSLSAMWPAQHRALPSAASRAREDVVSALADEFQHLEEAAAGLLSCATDLCRADLASYPAARAALAQHASRAAASALPGPAFAGALLALHRFWRARGHGPMPWLAGHALLLLAVMLGWVAFRAPDFASAYTLYAAMAGANFGGISDALAWQVTPDQWWCLWLGVALIYLPLLRDRLPLLREPAAITGLWRPAWAYWPFAAFLLGLVLLYSRAAVPFLYFQF
jgi:hypothetical protein